MGVGSWPNNVMGVGCGNSDESTFHDMCNEEANFLDSQGRGYHLN